MDKDVKVELVNHKGLHINNRNCKLLATAHQLDGLYVLDCVLDAAPESTKCTNIDNSCLLAPKKTGNACRLDAEKWMLLYRRLAHVGLKASEILLKVVAKAPKMTEMCDCEMSIVFKHFPPMTSWATEPLRLVHPVIYGPLNMAIRGGQYMLLSIDDATRQIDEYILQYILDALDKFKEWMPIRETNSGKQLKQFRTDGGGEYASKKFAEYLKSEGIMKQTTTPYSPQCNGFGKWVTHTSMMRV
jgi:hypothetical protein